MANDHSMAGLSFANVAEIIILDGQQNKYDKFDYINLNNNDMLINIDSDVNNMNPNSLKNQYKNYDTSIEFNETVSHDNYNKVVWVSSPCRFGSWCV